MDEVHAEGAYLGWLRDVSVTRFLEAKGLDCAKINKVLEGRPNVVDALKNGEIQLVLNTTESKASESDSKPIRQTALWKGPASPSSVAEAA